MLVVDKAKSETGKQRRKTLGARLLHCCCICHALESWGPTWQSFSSLKMVDDSILFPKYCSDHCAEKGGPKGVNVTKDMLEKAHAREYRAPRIIYRQATERELYERAARNQRTDNRGS